MAGPRLKEKTLRNLLEVVEDLGLDLSYVSRKMVDVSNSDFDALYDDGDSFDVHHMAARHHLQLSEEEINYALRNISAHSQNLLDQGEIDQNTFSKAQDLVEQVNNEMYRVGGENETNEASIDAGPTSVNIVNGRIEIASAPGQKWARNQPLEKAPELISTIANSLGEAIVLVNAADDVLGNLAKAQLLSVLEQAKKEIADPYVDKEDWKDRRKFFAGVRMALSKIGKSGSAFTESTSKLLKLFNGLIKEIDAFLDWFF